MIKFAAMAGAIDEEKVVLESLGSIKRAGADLIFSYSHWIWLRKYSALILLQGGALPPFPTLHPTIQSLSLTRCRTRLIRLTAILRSPGEFAATTRIVNGCQIARIAAFADRLDRAAKHLSERVLGSCETNQTCAGRPK